MRQKLTPGTVSGDENPNPGSDGTTTSKASAGSPPWAAGSDRGPMTLWKSQNVQGQPCVRTIGIGAGPRPRSCRKWIGMPSMVTRKCAWAFIARSWARQSNPSCQWVSSASRSWPRTP